jgi:hypothetical protein
MASLKSLPHSRTLSYLLFNCFVMYFSTLAKNRFWNREKMLISEVCQKITTFVYKFLRLKTSLHWGKNHKFGSMVPFSMFSIIWKNWQAGAAINIDIRNPFQCQLTRASNIWKRGSVGNCRMGGHSNIPSVDGTPGKFPE